MRGNITISVLIFGQIRCSKISTLQSSHSVKLLTFSVFIIRLWLQIWFGHLFSINVHLNFQANLNQRLQYHNFLKIQNYAVGSNILLNRMCTLNNKIPKDMTNGSYTTYKLKCKELFLKIWRQTLLLGTRQAPYDYCQGM